MKLELSKAEVESIEPYVHQHVRATNGLARRTWEKMWNFVNEEEDEQQATDATTQVEG